MPPNSFDTRVNDLEPGVRAVFTCLDEENGRTVNDVIISLRNRPHTPGKIPTDTRNPHQERLSIISRLNYLEKKGYTRSTPSLNSSQSTEYFIAPRK